MAGRNSKLAVLRELRRSLDRLLGNQLVRIILFGSMARGDNDDESDVDVAVITRGSSRELKHQILDEVAEIELEHDMPLSVLVFSDEEFDRLKKRERRIALDIEDEGVLL